MANHVRIGLFDFEKGFSWRRVSNSVVIVFGNLFEQDVTDWNEKEAHGAYEIVLRLSRIRSVI